MSGVEGSKTWEETVRWLREQPDQRELLAAAYYDDPLLSAANRYWQSEEWQSVRRMLPRTGGRALDVGAGRGIASFALAKEGFDVTALEPDGSELVGAGAIRDLAVASGLPIAVTQEFSERLPFDDGQFDVVFARAVLHHAKDMAASCREFLRVLKPGGLLIAVREHVISKVEHLPVFFKAHPLHRHYGGENAFLLSEYQKAIRTAGFELGRVLAPLESPINYAPYTIDELQFEIASRIGRRLPGGTAVVRALIRLPGVWPVLRRILERVDHRPGRLYSFIARRP